VVVVVVAVLVMVMMVMMMMMMMMMMMVMMMMMMMKMIMMMMMMMMMTMIIRHNGGNKHSQPTQVPVKCRPASAAVIHGCIVFFSSTAIIITIVIVIIIISNRCGKNNHEVRRVFYPQPRTAAIPLPYKRGPTRDLRATTREHRLSRMQRASCVPSLLRDQTKHTGRWWVASAMYVTRHTSHVTNHTSHVTRHKSQDTSHTSHVTRHTSHITHHTSHITHHTSHITHHRLPYSQPSAEGVKIVVDDVELHTAAADRVAFQERVRSIMIITNTCTAIVDRGIISISISISIRGN
jgi:hypothetical protein